MQERRADPRTGLDSEVWLGQEGVFTRTMSKLTDISVGGARIRTPETYQVGSTLSLRFTLGSGFIASTAVVRYFRSGSLGVEFIDLSSEDREKLEAFVMSEEAFLRSPELREE